MKLLFLALALLSTGVYGEKPSSETWKVVENGISIITDAIKNLEYSEIAEKFKLREKMEAAKDNAQQVEKVLEEYFDEVWKSYDANLYKNFPVFREKVFPVLKEFDDNLETLIKNSAKDLWTPTSDFFSGLTGEMSKFWESFAKIAENSRDKVRAEFDNVRVKIQPYADDVRAEYDKYKGNMKADWETKAQHVRDEVEKDLEELREKLKPHFEELKKYLIPHAEDVQKKISQLIREIHEYFTSEDEI